MDMTSIFENIRILSLAEQYPGPYATMLLADMGADVILVERPNGGDPARAYPPFFRALARNKRSVCVDLKSKQGREQLLSLAASADVVLEGFRPGTMDRLGVGYGTMKAVNERLIYVSISGFGQAGPYRDRTAHDLSYLAFAGHLFDRATGTRADFPNVSYGDLSSAMFAAFSIASALFGRERTGRGTEIDVSMTDGLISWMSTYVAPAMDGEVPFEILGEPAYGVFDVKGGRRITLSIAHEDHFWRALCALLDMPDASELVQADRLRERDVLRRRISKALSAHSLDHWQPLLDRHAVPWSPLNALADVIDDPHVRSRNLFRKLSRTDGTTENHVIQPVRFSAWSTDIRRPTPKLGEHSNEIFRDIETDSKQ
ncbi:CaiB/BaiF CoA-transferase family protein [Bradyrhizobium prioriisuperbiae]|uniref:CaiB/BaiF CoA transferase family protein n=1 Tax=Bradyrhizobium prioriisuperbiae TaxID=2854389 RepID=UPI0028EEFA78|nr:CaiB/BaiF CoA-transferase family protein [Bradyrhizobium prioritasuperba]